MLVAYGATPSHSQDTAQLVIACNMVVQATVGGGLGMRLGSSYPVRPYQIGINPAGLED